MNNYTLSKIKFFSSILFSVLFAYLISSIIFTYRLNLETSDIANYVNNFNRFGQIISYNINGYVDFIRYEAAFHWFFEWYVYRVGDAVEALRQISFFVALVIAFLLTNTTVRFASWVAILAVLSNPIVIDLMISQQRSAIAIAILITAFKSNIPRVVCLLVVVFVASIHLSSLAILIVYISYLLLQELFPDWLQNKKFYIYSAVVALFIVGVKDAGLSALEVSKQGNTSGLLYMSMWGVLFSAAIFSIPKRADLGYYLFITCFLMGFFSFLFGDSSSRFFAFGLVFYGMSDIRPQRKTSNIYLGFVYLVSLTLSYYYWL